MVKEVIKQVQAECRIDERKQEAEIKRKSRERDAMTQEDEHGEKRRRAESYLRC